MSVQLSLLFIVRAETLKRVAYRSSNVGKTGGVVLVLSGLVVGAYGLLGNNGTDEDFNQLGGDAKGLIPTAHGRLAASQAPALRAASSQVDFSAPVVVTLAPHAKAATELHMQTLAIPKNRDALARELQKELRRVGCYQGELNGAWTTATRRAMKDFIHRVNASLPIEQPDPILYIMVRGERDQVCGTPCPTGQRASDDGGCMPVAILAKSKNNAPITTATRSEPPKLPTDQPSVIAALSTTSADSPPPVASGAIDGRMALAGPRPREATKAVAATHPWIAPRPSTAGRRGPLSRSVFALNRSPN
jgi:Putative peptidoglycan binding domain